MMQRSSMDIHLTEALSIYNACLIGEAQGCTTSEAAARTLAGQSAAEAALAG